MATLPQSPGRKPHGVTPWFGIAIAAVFSLAILAFWLTRSRTSAPAAQVAMRDVQADRSWYHNFRAPSPTKPRSQTQPAVPNATPASAPTSMAMPTPAAVPYQASRPVTSDPAHEERIRHYQRAVSSDLMVKIDKGSTLETPRLLTAQQADHSPITVDAKPAPPHTISAWTFIYGTLETGIRSDHPGDVIGRVSQDVKDTVTQTETLIPMGSRLHGIQRGAQQVQLNDTSIVVTWDDIEFPNGGYIPIPRMPGTDSEGYPGFEDLVDRHLAQTWGPAVLVSAITAGTMLATRPTYGGINGYDPMQQAAGSFGQTLGTRAVGGLNSEASQTKPTITIREGYTFRVLVTRDMIFSGAYAQ